MPAEIGLLERDEVMATLRRCVAGAEAGRGASVALRAPAGVGKSTVLRAFREELRGRDLVLLHATGRDWERSHPYGVARQLLEPPLADAVVRRRLLVGAAVPLRVWFGEAEVALPQEPLAMVRAMYWTVVGLAGDRPVVIVVDDVHDADPGSLQFLAHLLQDLEELPIALVLAARPEDWDGRPEVRELSRVLGRPTVVPPLSVEAVAEVLRQQVGEPDREFADVCHAITGGNAFYVLELAREVAAVGAEPSAANVGWVRELGIPALARGALLRTAGLPEGSAALLEAAAVLGDSAALSDCARLAGLDVETAGTLADRMARAGLLADARGVEFAHPILRTATLADLPSHQRARLHRAAAALLHGRGAEAEIVAEHLVRAEPAGEAWAADLLTEHGRDLLYTGLSASAVPILGAAVAEAPERADADLLTWWGLARANIGDLDGIGVLRRGIEVTDDPEVRARRTIRLAKFLGDGLRLDEVLTLLEGVLATLPDHAEERPLTEAVHFLYARHTASGRERALAARERLAHQAYAGTGPGHAALRIALATDARHHRPREEVVELVRPALAPGLLSGLTELTPEIAFAALEVLLTLELDAEFDEVLEEVAAEALRRGAAVDVNTAAHFRALAAWQRGLPVDAEQEALHALGAGAWTGWHEGECASYALLGLARRELGKDAEADEDTARAGSIVGTGGKLLSLVRLAEGTALRRAGDATAALAAFEEAGEALTRGGFDAPGLLPWAGEVVAARLAAGQVDEAAGLAEEQVALARRVSGPRATAGALRALADCRGEVALLEQAVALVDGSGRPGSERVRSLLALGAHHRRAGRPAVARPHLQEAWELAQRIGAARLAERAREELRVAGARPRRGYVTGVEALTGSERRVAELAVAGLSNVEIAQRLFVTPKTVEKHLGATYRKLGVTRRRDLAGPILGESPH